MQSQIINVLIIDDDEQICSSLSTILNDEGYAVEIAKTGKQAIKTCKKTPFDVALIDIVLPDINGTELLLKLKQIQPKMINIFITGHPSIENAVKAIDEKADGYILKPANVQFILNAIKKAIKDKQTAYFQMFTEVEKAQKNTPVFKYQHPENW